MWCGTATPCLIYKSARESPSLAKDRIRHGPVNFESLATRPRPWESRPMCRDFQSVTTGSVPASADLCAVAELVLSETFIVLLITRCCTSCTAHNLYSSTRCTAVQGVQQFKLFSPRRDGHAPLGTLPSPLPPKHHCLHRQRPLLPHRSCCTCATLSCACSNATAAALPPKGHAYQTRNQTKNVCGGTEGSV